MGRINDISEKIKKYPEKYPYRKKQAISNDIDYIRKQISKTTRYRKKIELEKIEEKLMNIFRNYKKEVYDYGK